MNFKMMTVLLVALPILGFSQTIGYDLDKNGCNVAAGLTYSKLKKECIQPFNQPIMVVSVDDGTKSYSTQSPLIFSDDQKKVEVFLPDSDKTVILNQKKNGTTWKKCGVQVDKVANGYEVRQKGKLIYVSSAK